MYRQIKKNSATGLIKGMLISLSMVVANTSVGQPSAKVLAPSVSNYVAWQSVEKAFKIADSGTSASINIDPQDWKGVVRAARDLDDDVGKVTGATSMVMENEKFADGAILIGTIGKSRIIDKLIAEKKIDVTPIKGKWESFIIQKVGNNLVVAGSHKRGTILGIYDISEKIGVSPWYWWADAPVKKNKNLFVKPVKFVQNSPMVKYRGIFINDESPSFSGWARTKFGAIKNLKATAAVRCRLWPGIAQKAATQRNI